MSCAKETFAPISYDLFSSIKSGDRYPQSHAVTDDDVDQVLNRVVVEFRADAESASPDLLLDSEDDGITITSSAASAWAYTINDFTVSLSAGYYSFVIRCFYGDDNDIKTVMEGAFRII
jgi:hypothetical protein